jgi:predicted GIY-YIG superfamily endonuclease
MYCDNSIQDIGVSICLSRRLNLLNNNSISSRGDCCKLVYYEEYKSSEDAIKRETELKNISFSSLKKLIEENNPTLINLKI